MADARGDDRRDGNVEEEEDELGEQDYKAQKDAVIFAIEVSESMLASPPPSDDKKADRDSPLTAALKSAYEMMQQRIISNPRDMMGILLFGTEKTKYPGRDPNSGRVIYPHCYVYMDLDVPSAEDVKSLKAIVEEGEDEEGVLVATSEKNELGLMLFCANQMFATKAPNFGSKRLFLITNNDDPMKGDKKARDAAVNRAKDLYDLGIVLEIFPICKDTEQFDVSKFYNDITYNDPTAEETQERNAASKSGDGLSLLSSLVSNINSKHTPKRAYFSNMAFELGPGLSISVRGYIITNRQKPARSCYVWLDGETAQIAVGETSRVAEDTARTVENTEVKKAYKFGGEYVYFSEEEQSSIKQWGDKTIRIIGFKDRSQLKFWAAINKSLFIFPSEEGYVGSTRVFSALWKKLIKSKKIGIAWFMARSNSNPQLVAIIPSRSQSDETSGTQFLPAGLWLYPLPTADDVREPPEAKTVVRTTNKLTDQMNTVVRQLQLPDATYNPMKYPNPSLQWHYKILQALALEEEVPEQPEDKTVPKYRAIHKRCGGYIQDWAQVADDELAKVKDQKAIKHEMEDAEADEAPRPKKAKVASARSAAINSGDGGGIKDAELKKRAKADTLGKLTVADLRNVLGERGIETKGLKKELVERLEEYLGV